VVSLHSYVEFIIVVSLTFLGLAVGQIFFGPLSDSTGRKPAIYLGYALYICGAVLAIFSINFPMMLLGRLLQEIGAAVVGSLSTLISMPLGTVFPLILGLGILSLLAIFVVQWAEAQSDSHL